MSRIVPPPQVVITPVSEFRKTLAKKEPVQTTITQSMDSSNSSSDDDVFEKKSPKPDITPSKVVTPPPKKRVKKESPVKRRPQKNLRRPNPRFHLSKKITGTFSAKETLFFRQQKKLDTQHTRTTTSAALTFFSVA